MKVTLILLTAAVALFTLGAVSTNSPPSGEMIIPTNKSTNLNSSYVRMTKIVIVLDDDLSKWRGTIPWEAWRTNGGASRVIDRGEVNLTIGQLTTLFAAVNKKQAVRNLVLQNAALTETP